MRGPTAYETYLFRMRDYYKIKNTEEPAWIEKANEYYNFLLDSKHYFSDICLNTNIPKVTMEYLANPKKWLDKDLPQELIEGSADIIAVLTEMYEELISDTELYFVSKWTLSKKGRQKMREYIDRIPSAYDIMPPNNNFTNIP